MHGYSKRNVFRPVDQANFHMVCMVEPRGEHLVYCKGNHVIYCNPGLVPVPVKICIPGPGPGRSLNVMSSDIHLDTHRSVVQYLTILYVVVVINVIEIGLQKEPQDISFVLDYNWIPQESLRGDINIAGQWGSPYSFLPRCYNSNC